MKIIKIDVELFNTQRESLDVVIDTLDQESELFAHMEGIRNMLDTIYDNTDEGETVLIQDQVDEEPKKQYCIFGEDACKAFAENGVQGLIDGGIAHLTYVAEPGDDPLKVLAEYDGWYGYEMITEEQYLQLKAADADNINTHE